ncbi:hypothetical protein BD310DRAFT_654165 [Dichomitus squalens]|uniref:Uncharacterized protein n=1 Tax=Dichomitus squalens TaxID=114155 RepID=A0A4Q9PNG3_9APHY|nr:hypothetical protein BD310DRAFT_654165 [Dichomitus squalens]
MHDPTNLHDYRRRGEGATRRTVVLGAQLSEHWGRDSTRRNCRFRLSGRYFILCATMRFYILCFPPIRAVRNRSILPASILYSMGS